MSTPIVTTPMMSRPICYVAGPYTAKTIEQRNVNIANADFVARELAEKGYAPFVPHSNSQDWEHDGRFKHADFLEIDYAILERCHLVVLCGRPWDSKGTMQEIEWAKENGIPVFRYPHEVPPASEFKYDTTSYAVDRLLQRRRQGVSTYGKPLAPNNGRDSLTDAMEECADMLCYLLNEIAERGESS